LTNTRGVVDLVCSKATVARASGGGGHHHPTPARPDLVPTGSPVVLHSCSASIRGGRDRDLGRLHFDLAGFRFTASSTRCSRSRRAQHLPLGSDYPFPGVRRRPLTRWSDSPSRPPTRRGRWSTPSRQNQIGAVPVARSQGLIGGDPERRVGRGEWLTPRVGGAKIHCGPPGSLEM